jgi:hypothetical protein
MHSMAMKALQLNSATCPRDHGAIQDQVVQRHATEQPPFFVSGGGGGDTHPRAGVCWLAHPNAGAGREEALRWAEIRYISRIGRRDAYAAVQSLHQPC